MNNAIQVLEIYRHAGCWVFDAPEFDLCKEPFVMGSSEIIDSALPEGTREASLIFSSEGFPESIRIDRVYPESGGYWYQHIDDDGGSAGWLCPATLHYFDEFPESIYFIAEPTSGSHYLDMIYELEDEREVMLDFIQQLCWRYDVINPWEEEE